MLDRYRKHTMNRILKPDGRVMMVAMDHARMNGIFRGLEDPLPILEAIIEGGADAIMTSYGIMKHFGHVLDGKIAKVLRVDTGASKYRDAGKNSANGIRCSRWKTRCASARMR